MSRGGVFSLVLFAGLAVGGIERASAQVLMAPPSPIYSYYAPPVVVAPPAPVLSYYAPAPVAYYQPVAPVAYYAPAAPVPIAYYAPPAPTAYVGATAVVYPARVRTGLFGRTTVTTPFYRIRY